METAQSNIDCLLVLPPASLKGGVCQVKPAQTFEPKNTAYKVVYKEWLPGGITAVARVFRKVDTRAGQQGIVWGERRMNLGRGLVVCSEQDGMKTEKDILSRNMKPPKV